MIATRDRHEVASETRTYQLLIEVARPVRVDVGALGAVTFDAGQYVYTGSAIRNLEARIARHLSADTQEARRCASAPLRGLFGSKAYAVLLPSTGMVPATLDAEVALRGSNFAFQEGSHNGGAAAVVAS